MQKLNVFWEKNKGKIVFTVLFILTLISLYFFKKYYYIFKSPESFKNFITSFGYFSFIIFIAIQILQVIIFFVPGEVVQVAGGIAYGPILGSILSLTGIMIGSTIIFIIAKKLGKKIILKIVPNKYYSKVEGLLNNEKINLIVFIIYLLPGMPKDTLIFLFALSSISLTDFLLYSGIGRIPALFVSCYFGSSILERNKIKIILLSIIIIAAFLIGIFGSDYFFKKITHYFKTKFKNKKGDV